MKRIYLDSNVFISLVGDEIGRDFTLLSEDSRKFAAVCAKKGFILVLSTWLFKEVKGVISFEREDIIGVIQEQGINFELSEPKQNISKEIMRIRRDFGLHHSDAVHVAIAKYAGCDLIVSWNKKDFEKAESIVKCRTPKEIIGEDF